MIEITRKSASEMVSVTPKMPATALASTARAAETNRVRAIEATTFWPTTVSRRRDRLNVPVWIDVPRRLPSAPKMLPRMPMAAGTSTSRPGSASRVSRDGAEGQPGEEITAGGDQQRRQRLSQPGRVGAHSGPQARDEAGERPGEHCYSEGPTGGWTYRAMLDTSADPGQ